VARTNDVFEENVALLHKQMPDDEFTVRDAQALLAQRGVKRSPQQVRFYLRTLIAEGRVSADPPFELDGRPRRYRKVDAR
jgi:hypothetical protein